VKVLVRLFAAARQLAGAETLELQIPAGAAVSDLRRRLAEEYPQLVPILPHVAFALNSQYAEDKSKIPPGAEIACIPPVSGG